jgi:hypothetical protein
MRYSSTGPRGVFTQIIPVWVGDLGTRPKIQKNYGWSLKFKFLSANFLGEKGYLFKVRQKVFFYVASNPRQ